MALTRKYWLNKLSILWVALCLLPLQGQAVVLDWDSVNWISGNLSQSFDIDASNPGNDITITITGDTGYFAQNVNDNSNLTGGLSPTEQSLFLNMNYSSEYQLITISVVFHYDYGVEDVSFSLFDIDRNDSSSSNVGYRDRIDLLGITLGNELVAPTTITEHPDNDVRSSGTNVYVRGDNGTPDTGGSSADGNIDYAFSGTNVINQFFFTYGNHSSAPSNPGNQWISLHDISYKPKVPEWHPGLIASFACLMMVGVRRFFF